MASDTAHRHVQTWMHRQFTEGAHTFVTDVTSAYAQLNVQGPRSRELMQAVTSHDLSNEAFGFRAVAEIDIGFARVICVRITYLGELGYELYIPTEQALHVYDRLIAAGEPMGLRHAGLKALASLRMEKGPTATTATTSTTPTRRSRPGSGSRCGSTSRAGSLAATPCSRKNKPAR